VRTPAEALGVLAASLLAGVAVWVEAGVFEPIARGPLDVEHVFVSASAGVLAASVAGVGAMLLALRALATRAPDAASAASRSRRLVGFSALTLVPTLALISPLVRSFPALTYVVYDLRWCWYLAALVGWLGPIGSVLRARASATATVIAVPIVLAVAFTPNLRFSGALHGDEPKYLRYGENFFQGIGFDIARKQLLTDRVDDRPHTLRNFRLLWEALPAEVALLWSDALALVRGRSEPRLAGGEPGAGMFFEGKHPGTVYQLHNPGLSFLLYPGYYLDRRLTGQGVGYQQEFPASLPALHVILLALYLAYGLALYALLTADDVSRSRAGVLAAMGMAMLPAGAFAFQIYPEIAAGAAVFILVRSLLPSRAPGTRSRAAELSLGVLAGFLPWLHIRFAAVTVVVALWTFGHSGAGRRVRPWFLTGVAVMLAALSLYTYRLTGSLLPSATYGDEAPLSLARIARGLPAFAFDRVWGLLPHAPLYLLAAPGILLMWRRRPAQVWLIALVLLAVAVPAAGHGIWAGGSTPGRYLVAVAPLLLLFVAETMTAWSPSWVYRAAFLTLGAVSVDSALRYNWHHVKEYGPLVAKSLSGWRINLLFPSMGTETWSAAASDLVLLVIWGVAVLLLVALPFRVGALRGPWHTPPAREVAAMAAGLGMIALLGTTAAAATGTSRAADYLMPSREARERALALFASLPRCSICYFSAIGFVDPAVALGNDLGLLDVQIQPDVPRPGNAVRLRVRPRSRSGEYIVAAVRADFGDSSTASRPRAFADVDFAHAYSAPGSYTVQVWARTPGGEQLTTTRLVVVAPP
jgi:hypothetical protein